MTTATRPAVSPVRAGDAATSLGSGVRAVVVGQDPGLVRRHVPGDHLGVGVRVEGAPVRADRESPRDAGGPVDADDLAVLDRGRQQRRLGLRGPLGLVRLRGQQQRQVRRARRSAAAAASRSASARRALASAARFLCAASRPPTRATTVTTASTDGEPAGPAPGGPLAANLRSRRGQLGLGALGGRVEEVPFDRRRVGVRPGEPLQRGVEPGPAGRAGRPGRPSAAQSAASGAR